MTNEAAPVLFWLRDEGETGGAEEKHAPKLHTAE